MLGRQPGQQLTWLGVTEHGAPFFMRLRRLIASKLPSYELSGEVEADEGYLVGIRKGRGHLMSEPEYGYLFHRLPIDIRTGRLVEPMFLGKPARMPPETRLSALRKKILKQIHCS
ncbi:MAG: hypothetical protein KBC46_05790 [Ferrovibrio sp.]|nr:hypothetical protein [Ferrovibrio sp.]